MVGLTISVASAAVDPSRKMMLPLVVVCPGTTPPVCDQRGVIGGRPRKLNEDIDVRED